jgi:propanol-preferring alcohol dehydrogenase
LEEVERPVPQPGPGEVLLRVRVCGVCRTDLHLAEGELAAKVPHRIPGHEVVGEVVERGPDADRFAYGDRVGIAWLRSTCGRCRWCRAGRENLCPSSAYTGWDADGGYTAYAVVPDAYAYRIPPGFSDEAAAPLLCSGIIGYRALRRANLPPGGRLGIYGFGASAHLTLQVALAQGAEVHVLTRDRNDRELALRLGAASVGGAANAPPTPLDAAILFAPVGDLVPPALAALDDGGTLAVAGIHLSDVPGLDYQRHLFREKVLTSVTSNTRADGEEFLRIAARLELRPHTTAYPLAMADQALDDVATGNVSGAAVLLC